MILGKEDQAFFFVSPGGFILSIKCPIQEPIHSLSFHIHSADITKVDRHNRRCKHVRYFYY